MYNPREAQRDFLYFKHASMFIAAAIGIVAMALSFREGTHYMLLSLSSKMAVGTVTQAPSLYYRRVRYFFVDHKGVRRYGYSWMDSDSAFPANVGSLVNISYSPIFHEVSEYEPWVNNLKVGFYFLIGGLAIVLLSAVYSFFNILTIVKHRRKDRYY